MRKLKNIHPGEILLKEFLEPFNISVSKIVKDTGISQSKVSKILKNEDPITAEIAIRLGLYFGNTAKFWLGLQDDYDLEEVGKLERKKLVKIKRLNFDAA